MQAPSSWQGYDPWRGHIRLPWGNCLAFELVFLEESCILERVFLSPLNLYKLILILISNPLFFFNFFFLVFYSIRYWMKCVLVFQSNCESVSPYFHFIYFKSLVLHPFTFRLVILFLVNWNLIIIKCSFLSLVMLFVSNFTM